MYYLEGKILSCQVLLKRICFPCIEDPALLNYMLEFLFPCYAKLIQTTTRNRSVHKQLRLRITVYVERITVNWRRAPIDVAWIEKHYVCRSFLLKDFLNLVFFEVFLRDNFPNSDLLEPTGENVRSMVQSCRLLRPGFVVLKHNAFELENIQLDIFAY